MQLQGQYNCEGHTKYVTLSGNTYVKFISQDDGTAMFTMIR